MAVSKYIHIARKLQTACKKLFGIKLLIDQKQWYHKDRDTAITVYTLYQVVIDEQKSSKIKLFQTYSQVQLVLFMRDFWYMLNGWEIPHDNPIWEGIKQKYGEKAEPSEQEPCSKNNDSEERGTDGDRTTIYNELYTNWQRDRVITNDSGTPKTNI